MARWKLTASHYLNVPGTEWEYNEISRSTGKPVRTRYPVPLLLDINDPSQWTEKVLGMDGKPFDGFIIVCHEGKGIPADTVFLGPPTPDMEPVDEEAKVISAECSRNWVHPINDLPAQGGGSYYDNVIDGFQKQIAELQVGVASPAAPVSVGGVSKDEFATLQVQMAEVMKQNSLLLAKLLEQPQIRRV